MNTVHTTIIYNQRMSGFNRNLKKKILIWN